MQQVHPPTTVARLTFAALLALAVALSGTFAQEPGERVERIETEEFTFDLELVAEGFTAPVYLTTPPDDDRRFVVDQAGMIHRLEEDGTRADEYFLDLRDRLVEFRPGFDERGVLGLAFHPDFADNGLFYVHYSAPLRPGAFEPMNHTGRISEFRVSDDDENRADPDSERIIFEVDQPQFNHNGGQIEFGPDGYLYIGLGDGGGAHDTGAHHPPLGHGQDITTLLGNILRIDVDVDPAEEERRPGLRAYGIPSGNPFYDEEVDLDEYEDVEWSGQYAREEIYAWGMRNPYRFSFDRDEGHLWVADVGQNLWEEVNRIEEPGNYGWNLMEGTHRFDPDNPSEVIEETVEEGPRGEELRMPIIEYGNVGDIEDGRGISVIGGYVYRGSEIQDLQGYYVFGDWSQSFQQAAGKLFVAGPDGETRIDRHDDLDHEMWGFYVDHELPYFVLGFGQDNDGELYLLVSQENAPTGETGRVYRLRAPEMND